MPKNVFRDYISFKLDLFSNYVIQAYLAKAAFARIRQKSAVSYIFYTFSIEGTSRATVKYWWAFLLTLSIYIICI